MMECCKVLHVDSKCFLGFNVPRYNSLHDYCHWNAESFLRMQNVLVGSAGARSFLAVVINIIRIVRLTDGGVKSIVAGRHCHNR